MLTKTTTIALLAIALGATGCTFDQGYDPAGSPQTLESRLGTREALSLDQTSLVGVGAYDDAGNPLPCLQPSVNGGDAMMRATPDGVLVVEKMTINLSDVVVEPGVVYDAPINLTDIQLRLGTQLGLDTTWSDDGMSATGTGHADLLMDWAVLSNDGKVLPLATQKLRNVEFDVRATLGDDGLVHAEVMSAVDGRLGGITNHIELSDFSMAVHANSEAYPL